MPSNKRRNRAKNSVRSSKQVMDYAHITTIKKPEEEHPRTDPSEFVKKTSFALDTEACLEDISVSDFPTIFTLAGNSQGGTFAQRARAAELQAARARKELNSTDPSLPASPPPPHREVLKLKMPRRQKWTPLDLTVATSPDTSSLIPEYDSGPFISNAVSPIDNETVNGNAEVDVAYDLLSHSIDHNSNTRPEHYSSRLQASRPASTLHSHDLEEYPAELEARIEGYMAPRSKHQKRPGKDVPSQVPSRVPSTTNPNNMVSHRAIIEDSAGSEPFGYEQLSSYNHFHIDQALDSDSQRQDLTRMRQQDGALSRPNGYSTISGDSNNNPNARSLSARNFPAVKGTPAATQSVARLTLGHQVPQEFVPCTEEERSGRSEHRRGHQSYPIASQYHQPYQYDHYNDHHNQHTDQIPVNLNVQSRSDGTYPWDRSSIHHHALSSFSDYQQRVPQPQSGYYPTATTHQMPSNSHQFNKAPGHGRPHQQPQSSIHKSRKISQTDKEAMLRGLHAIVDSGGSPMNGLQSNRRGAISGPPGLPSVSNYPIHPIAAGGNSVRYIDEQERIITEGMAHYTSLDEVWSASSDPKLHGVWRPEGGKRFSRDSENRIEVSSKDELRKQHEAELDEWFTLDSRVTIREKIQLANAIGSERQSQGQDSTDGSSAHGLSASQEMVEELLIPAMGNLLAYKNESGKGNKQPLNPFGPPPSWAIDHNPGANGSFFSQQWGTPPQRVGRDPRYRAMQHDGRSSVFEDPTGRLPREEFSHGRRGWNGQ